MSDTKYTYAVARIRALENALFTDAVIEQILACPTAEQALQFVKEKGWGSGAADEDMDSLLNREEEKAWEVIRDVAPDIHLFDVLSYPKLYHNLKAAVKKACTGAPGEHIFYEDCSIPGQEMLKIVENKEFSRLPGNMPGAAQEAFETLLHTGDGQLCDVLIDRAALEAVFEAGEKSGEPIIRDYADTTVAIADIRIAVRARKTGKTAEFMQRAMAPCRSISTEQLIRAALAGEDEISRYLAGTAYAGGAEALKESPSAFERWCDDRMTEIMKPQKYQTFSVGPLLGYLTGRQNEIKTVRIILTGKQNGFPDDAIRERIRDMYV